MRPSVLVVLCGLLLAGCFQDDSAYRRVSLQTPYSMLQEAPAGAMIERGTAVPLSPQQQEAVIAAVRKWMKDPASASFGNMVAARTRRGGIVVCGEVTGRNAAGAVPPMAPFIGMLTPSPSSPEFVVVDIAGNGRPRVELETLCRQSGAA